jgi:hypothetical protein
VPSKLPVVPEQDTSTQFTVDYRTPGQVPPDPPESFSLATLPDDPAPALPPPSPAPGGHQMPGMQYIDITMLDLVDEHAVEVMLSMCTFCRVEGSL